MVVRENLFLSFSMKHVLLLFILSSSITIPAISSETPPMSPMLNTSPSCTIFTVAIGDTVFYGNNEDWRTHELGLWYIPSQDISTMEGSRSIYGGVFIGFPDKERGDLYLNPCGGMNEHGLIFDINGLPSLALYDNPNGSDFWTHNVCYFGTSLWDCKTVEEVIEWYKAHKWDMTIGGQLHYADASGDAVVISVNPSTNEWAFTRKTGNFLISTNFNLNDTRNAYDYPCYRYNAATEMLSEIDSEENLTVQACADILYEVHLSSVSCYTLYSNIFDPVNLDLYLNYGEYYQKQKKIHLPDVLSQWWSFEQFNISYMTGVDGNLLVRLVEIDEDFYTAPTISTFHFLSFLAATVVIIISGLYVHKKRV